MEATQHQAGMCTLACAECLDAPGLVHAPGNTHRAPTTTTPQRATNHPIFHNAQHFTTISICTHQHCNRQRTTLCQTLTTKAYARTHTNHSSSMILTKAKSCDVPWEWYCCSTYLHTQCARHQMNQSGHKHLQNNWTHDKRGQPEIFLIRV